MSHIVTVQTEVRDSVAIASACRRIGLPTPVDGTHRLYGGQVTGMAVQLPRWRFPVVCDTAVGRLHFDNFGGRWGEQKELDRFLQSYAAEKAKLEALRRGHTVTEQSLPDGSLKLTIQVAGGAA